MNRARIIEMAKEAGVEPALWTTGEVLVWEADTTHLERFAALVLAQAMEPAGSGAGHSTARSGEPSTTPPAIDTGDFVLHRPTGEEWVVAYVRGDRLAACGWPDTLADLSDCELVKKATPEKRQEMLELLAASSGHRAAYAIEVLHREHGGAPSRRSLAEAKKQDDPESSRGTEK